MRVLKNKPNISDDLPYAVYKNGFPASGSDIQQYDVTTFDAASSVMYVFKRIKERGYETEIVPGITSFSAAAAALKTSLCERSEPLHIIPASYKGEDFDSLRGTKVYMKSGKGLPELRERLKGRGAMMVENATMENERIYESFDDTEGTPGYFSLVIVPAESGGEE